MATVPQNLANIINAKYGRDVRQAIHDSIEACYTESKIVPRGAYSSAATYAFPDVVTYSGGSYLYIYPSSSTNKVPTNATYWMPVATKGDIGPQGEQGVQGPQGVLTPSAEKRLWFGPHYSPQYDLIHDNGARDFVTAQDAFSTPILTGQSWQRVSGEGYSDTALIRYMPGSNLVFSGSGSPDVLNSAVIDYNLPNIMWVQFRVKRTGTQQYLRNYFIKFIDASNWLAIGAGGFTANISICIDGVITNLATYGSTSTRAPHFNLEDWKAFYMKAHAPQSGGNRVIVLYHGMVAFDLFLSTEQHAIFNIPAKIGMGAPYETHLLGISGGAL